MARFRTVYLYPYSGWPQLPWDVERDAQGPFDDDRLDRDAAARSARAVTEAISLELQAESVESRRSSYSVNLLRKPSSVDIEVGDDLTFVRDGFLGRLLISQGFRHLLPIERASILTDVVYRFLVPLADAEGWRESLDRAVERVRAGGLKCVWGSAWKRAPDRLQQVRIVVQIADDGFGRWRVEIADMEGVVLRKSPELLGWTWVENFRRMAKDMRFDADRHLVVGRGSMFVDNVTTIDISTGSLRDDRSSHGADTTPLRYPGRQGRPLPRVIDEPIPPVSFTGGAGPISDDIMQYHTLAARLNEQIESGAWVEWWQGAGVTEVDLSIWYTGAKPKILVRKVDGRLIARRYRPPGSIPRSAEDAQDLARSDVELLLSKVRARFALPEPPILMLR